MRWLWLILPFALLLAGANLIRQARTLPVYTDPAAPEHLSAELASQPREVRFREWYARLETYETPHKKLDDLGHGLCAAGVGFLLAGGVWSLYHRFRRLRTTWAVLLLWFVFWGLRIPLSIWYYYVRELRFDYPTWGDSIAIPVFSECIAWGVGGVLTTLVLARLLVRHPLPDRIRLVWPRSVRSWCRAGLLVAWIGFLAVCIIPGVPDGDAGSVLPLLPAMVILLAVLAATETARPGKSF